MFMTQRRWVSGIRLRPRSDEELGIGQKMNIAPVRVGVVDRDEFLEGPRFLIVVAFRNWPSGALAFEALEVVRAGRLQPLAKVPGEVGAGGEQFTAPNRRSSRELIFR